MRPTPLKDLLTLIDVPSTCEKLIEGAAIDSRLAKPADLFFALKGLKTDGHEYLKAVAEKKVAAAIVNSKYTGPDFGLELVRVKDVKAALQDLARAFLQTLPVKVIAITGSLGKTTVKEWTKTLVGSSFKLFAPPLSYNSQLSVPMSLLNMQGDEEVVLLEMGMSEPGNIANLVSIAPPDIAVLTTVSMQHADAFEDGLLGIAKEKSAIFSHKKTTIGLMPAELAHRDLIEKVGSCSKVTFSTSSDQADFILNRQDHKAYIQEKTGLSFDCLIDFPLRIYDHNFLAAVAIARLMGIDGPIIKQACPFLKLPPMRFEITKKNTVTFINDAFNANAEAMCAALEGLKGIQAQGRKIAVLSEMTALGAYSDKGHEVVANSALKNVDILFCLGPRCLQMKQLFDAHQRPCFWFSNFEDLKIHFSGFVKSHDVVLLKGARSYALERLLRDE